MPSGGIADKRFEIDSIHCARPGQPTPVGGEPLPMPV
jgi:hypothetical protein